MTQATASHGENHQHYSNTQESHTLKDDSSKTVIKVKQGNYDKVPCNSRSSYEIILMQCRETVIARYNLRTSTFLKCSAERALSAAVFITFTKSYEIIFSHYNIVLFNIYHCESFITEKVIYKGQNK